MDNLKEAMPMNRVRIVSTFTAVFTLISIAVPVFAHEEGACREDIKKLCGDVKPGGGGIRDCMKAHEADLSQGCKDNMAEGKKKFEEKKKELEQACQADIKQFCANVTPGQGREFACLRAYEDKISAGCKEKMPKGHMGMHKGMHHGDKDKDDHDEGQEGSPAGK
jgi:hypothetical protein